MYRTAAPKTAAQQEKISSSPKSSPFFGHSISMNTQLRSPKLELEKTLTDDFRRLSVCNMNYNLGKIAENYKLRVVPYVTPIIEVKRSNSIDSNKNLLNKPFSKKSSFMK